MNCDDLHSFFPLAVEPSDLARAADRTRLVCSDNDPYCPEGAATYAAYLQAAASGKVRSSERVVLFNCASGLKYPMPAVTQHMDVRRPFAPGIRMPPTTP